MVPDVYLPKSFCAKPKIEPKLGNVTTRMQIKPKNCESDYFNWPDFDFFANFEIGWKLKSQKNVNW